MANTDPFILNPDFEILRPYFWSQLSEEEWQEKLRLHKLNRGKVYFRHINSETEKNEFEEKFDKLLNNYDLIDHYDNLLYVSIDLYEELWQGIYSKDMDLMDASLCAELAQILLFFKKNHLDQIEKITLKRKNKEPILIKEKAIIQFIADSIFYRLNNYSSSHELGNYWFSMFGKRDLNSDFLEKVIREGKPLKLAGKFNDATAEFCLRICEYLNKETSLKSDVKTLSNDQLRFFRRLTSLMKIINKNKEEINVDNMRRLIISYRDEKR
ncbi:hypothetical protein C3K47_08800 [Solitalea longa]|uniref:Uncharacterized protein n=1 Tax=Solitalea longa TaxID=2079460 RepID=A0A2S5A3N4_9SPHI|nr:hypothetical protein [Solitalea longa]POY37146.1 hypothetical protein C3K47_08800 [Solitalea longa]